MNRVGDVMAHTRRYAFKGVGRLARDAGISPAALSRIINGEINPSALMVSRLANALERELGLRIDPRDLVAEEGRFLRRFACDLCGCRGCLPESAIDEYGETRKAFVGIKPGRWVTSRYPRGYEITETGGNHAD